MMKSLLPLLVGTLLLADSTRPQAAETAARWNPRTTNWNVKPRPAIGDWGFDRPGYPPGLYLRLIHEQFARDPHRPLLVNIGGQGATLAFEFSP